MMNMSRTCTRWFVSRCSLETLYLPLYHSHDFFSRKAAFSSFPTQLVPRDFWLNGLETQVKSLKLLMLHPWCGLIRFTLEPCISTLNIFQDFVFRNFKQEQQCLCNYWLLKLLLGITKVSPSLNACLRYFWLQKYRHCMSVKIVLPKHSIVIFGLFFFQEKFEKSIVL